MATGIRDKVAIIGMGCTRFGERWESGAEELMTEAFTECLEDAGVEVADIEAACRGFIARTSRFVRSNSERWMTSIFA